MMKYLKNYIKYGESGQEIAFELRLLLLPGGLWIYVSSQNTVF